MKLANAPANSRKLLSQHRAAITDAQGKLAPLVKRRGELEDKRGELLDQASEPDPMDGAAIEQHAAAKRQLALIEDGILALDPQVEAAERLLRVALIHARNLAARPILEAECPTVLQDVVKGVRQWCHTDSEAEGFARQLPALGDYELWCGLPFVETVPLEEATERMLAILDALSRGENPFRFETGL